MLTLEKANKILKLVTDKQNLIIKEDKAFCCYYNIFDKNVIEIEGKIKEGYYKNNILNYLYKQGLEKQNVMFRGSVEVFSLLHEIGHVLNGDTITTNNAINLMQDIEGTAAQFEAYRNIENEKKADQFAINILNNEQLNIKIWAIMEESTEAVAKENKEVLSMLF